MIRLKQIIEKMKEWNMTEEQLEILKKHIPNGFTIKEIFTDGIVCTANIGYRFVSRPYFVSLYESVPCIWIECVLKINKSSTKKFDFTTEYSFYIDERYKNSKDILDDVTSSIESLIFRYNEKDTKNEDDDEDKTKLLPYINIEFEENKDETFKRLNENINDCDEEIQDLLLLLNKVDGIYTLKSTFGNHEEPCKIWFRAKDLKSLNDFAFKFLEGVRYWEIHYDLNDIDASNHLYFILQTNTSNEKLNKTYVEWLMSKLKEEEK